MFLRLVLVCGFLLLVLGCGGAQPSQVSGLVTLDGQPLKTGAVTFHPTGTGPTVVGQIDTTGKFSLATGTDAGLIPGDYVATVVATEELVESKDPKAAPQAPKLITPVRYGDREQSGLKFKVEAGANTINIDLKSN